MDLTEIKKKRKKVFSQLNALKSFPNTKTVRQLRKELQQRLAFIERKIQEEITATNIKSKRIIKQGEKEREKKIKQQQQLANQSRSRKLSITII